MKKFTMTIFVLLIAVLAVVFFIKNNNVSEKEITISPISHATMVLEIGDEVIYVDPTGGREAFDMYESATLVLVTDIHGDHLNIETLSAVVDENTTLLVPQAVSEELPEEINKYATVISNGEQQTHGELTIEAMPMYNLPDQEEIRHEKGRGNGYLIDDGTSRIYIAGDTADIPEMRSLENIDIAFVPMNLPFTMSVERAADAVLEFAPQTVYPYHYRGRDGLSDVELFKTLVNEGNSSIEVVQLDWYPETDVEE